MMTIIFSLLLVCVHNIVQCAENVTQLEVEEPLTQPLPFATNGLLIFLDQGNETGDKMGVVGSDLFEALSQKPCAILASRLLIRDIIKQPTPKEFVKKLKDEGNAQAIAYEKLVASREAIKKYLASTPQNPSDQEQWTIAFTMNSMLPPEFRDVNKVIDKDFDRTFNKEFYSFNADEWIIKQVHDQLLLLVPKEYIDKMNTHNFAQYYSQEIYSPTELNLGIKIDHLPTVASIETYANEYKAPAETNSGKFLLDSLANLFIPRANTVAQPGYREINKKKLSTAHMPQWTIYLMGHGSNGSIVNMSIDHFKQLLAFFDSKIVTKLVTYTSCYGAGSNAQKIYEDLRSAGLKTNPYTVVTAALTDAPLTRRGKYSSTVFAPSVIDFKNHVLKPIYSLNFKKFIEIASQDTTVNFMDLLKNIFPEQLLKDPSFIFGSPQIKLPGVEWFNLVNIDSNIVSIGQTLATSRSANQPLDILKFFSKTKSNPPIGILLYANIVPFELIIPVQMPILVPMIPGDSYHEFAKITVSSTLKDFFAALMPLKTINYKKIIVIKKLKVIATSSLPDTEFENVIIKVGYENITQYVTNKLGTQLQWDASSNELKPTSEYPNISLFDAKNKQVEKAQEKMTQAENIRKAQERKLSGMQQKKEPAQVITEMMKERKTEEEQKEFEQQEELKRQQISQAENEEEKAREKRREQILLAQQKHAKKIQEQAEKRLPQLKEKYKNLPKTIFTALIKALGQTNFEEKNESYNSMPDFIISKLNNLKETTSKEPLLEKFNIMTSEFNALLDEYEKIDRTTSADSDVRKEMNDKLEQFKIEEIDTMPS